MAMCTNPEFFVRVEFSRSIASATPRPYPWHWAIVIQRGHMFHISDADFPELADAVADFLKNGVEIVAHLEKGHP